MSTDDSQVIDISANRFGSLASERLSNQVDIRRAMSVTPNPDLQKPWEFYASTFSQQLRGTDDWSFLHMSVTPDYLDFDDPQYGLYYLIKFCDAVPLWQGRYAQGPLSFYDAYKYIVMSYAINYAADPQLQALAREKAYIVGVTVRDFDDGWIQCGQDWVQFDAWQRKTFPPNRWKSFDNWYAGGWSKNMKALRDRVTIATANYQSVMNQMGIGQATLAEAISNATNDAYFVKAPSPDGLEFSYPSYTLDKNFGKFIDSTLAQLRQDPNHYDFHFAFNYQTGYYHETNTQFGAGGTISLGGGFAVDVGGTWEEHTIDTTSSNFSVDVKFGGFQEFVMKPGGWFSPAVLQLIQNGPWVDKSPVQNWINSGRSVWGPSGFLPLEPMSIFVGVQPRIQVSLSHTEYYYYRRAWQANVGVSFFGFPVGGAGGSGSTVNISWNDTTSTFEIIDVSGRPVLVAVRSQKMPP